MVSINKDTKIFGSFSREPGNWGCQFHNRGFQSLEVNAIYRSFSVRSIERAIEAMRTLGISGVGISMPFKQEVTKWVDVNTTCVQEIGAANTLVNDGTIITAYNTDWLAAKRVLRGHKHDLVYVLGKGGYSKAVQYACKQLEMNYEIITRDSWDRIKDLSGALIFNCTPVGRHIVKPPESCEYIDCLIQTQTGQALSMIQASEQFKLYTGQNYPCRISNSV